MARPEEHLPDTLQESVLAVLATDVRYGPIVAGQVRPEHFDGRLHDVAAAVLAYYRQYGRPPGEGNLAAVVTAGRAGERSAAVQRMATRLLAQAVTINAAYVASRAGEFAHRQTLLAAVAEATERFLAGEEEGVVADVEGILRGALDHQRAPMEAGTFLSDSARGLQFLDRPKEGYKLGIGALDDAGIGLHPGELLLYVAPKNCLVGETLIDCPRDLTKYPLGIPIRDLVGTQFLTYSWDFDLDRPRLSRVSDVWRVGSERVYRVRLKAGFRTNVGNRKGGTGRARYLPPLELVGTFDHPVLLSDGSWRRLGELRAGDSLKSLYRRATGKPGASRTRLSWTGVRAADGVAEHRFICEQLHGPGRSIVRKPGAWRGDDLAHHQDGNRLNNTPDNIRWMEASEHDSHHLSERNRAGTVGWQKTGEHPRGMVGKKHSDAVKERISATTSELAKKRLRGPGGTFLPNHEVVSVEYVGVRDVYDMSVDGTENFVANGVFVHNSGKSWFAVHCGRQALMQGAKFVHVTLEMGTDQVIGRYYQSLFGAGWSADKVQRTELEFDDLDRLSGFHTERVAPKKSFAAPDARKWLRGRIQHWGTRLGRLVVREFPSGTLTLPHLESYLDYLEAAHNFVPHGMAVDYPDLMEVPLRDYRLGLGRMFVGLRGLAQKRSMFIVAPTQGNRTSLRASNVHSDMVSEDVSKVFTADSVLTYSQTEGEERLNLARLHVDYARSAARGQTVLMAQSYPTGQYVLQSALMTQAYWDRLEEASGDPQREREDGEEGDTRSRRRRVPRSRT